MSQHKDLQYWKKKKVEVEQAVKVLALKREKTLYLYEVEKRSRRKTREQQLRTLLEYETRELQQTQIGLQNINATISLLEREQQKHSSVKVIGLVSLMVVMVVFAGLLLYDGIQDHLTGAVVGIQLGVDTNCREEYSCVNETITTCKNETVQKCDAACVNKTKKTCIEECKPECHPEEINGMEREVCVKRCSNVCDEEIVQNCGSCVDTVEEKCSSDVVQQCSTKTLCDESSDITGGVTAGIVEESPVGIQPIVEPIEVPASEELDVQPIEKEIPLDEMTGGAISIPEEEPALEIPVEEETPEVSVPPVVEEPIEETLPEPIVENPPEEAEPEPIENPGPAPEESVKEQVEQPVEKNEEEGFFFGSVIQAIQNFIWPEDLNILAINRMVLNTTYVTQGNGNVNLTAYTAGTDVKYIYNWKRNDTPIAVVHMTFDGGSDPAHAVDYSGLNNIYNSSYQGKTLGYVDGFNGSGGGFSVDADRCNGAANAEEWDVNGTVLVDHNGVRLLNDTNANRCVATQDGYLGVGFIMYTKTVVSTRFTAFASNHEHFIYVNYTAADGWRYDSNTAWTSFTPEDTDVLVAYVDSNLDTVTEFPFLPNLTLNGYNGSRGMLFNGSSDYVNLTDDPNFDFSGGPFSISMWVRANATAGTTEVLAAKFPGGANAGYELRFVSGQPDFLIRDSVTSLNANNATATGWKDDKWHHWAAIYNGSQAFLYIDGILRGVSASVATGSVSADNANELRLGTRSGASGSAFFNGTLDEFMLFNRSLSSAEVWALWSNQSNSIAAEELRKGDKWTVEVTPNTGTADGTMMSQSVWIYPPVINVLTLNSTDPHTNDTSVNLTAYANVSDADGDSVKVIYNWLVNGTPIAVVNMPFEEINGTPYNKTQSSGFWVYHNNTWDYSGFGLHGNVTTNSVGAPIWNRTGGYDGNGSYDFSGIVGSISLGNSSTLKSVCRRGCTMSAWIKLGAGTGASGSGSERTIVSMYASSAVVTNNQFYNMDMGQVQSDTLTFEIFHNGSTTGGASRTCQASSPKLQNSTWLFVTGRYNLTHTAVFVNGTQLGVAACSFANISEDSWMAGNVSTKIGSKSWNTDGSTVARFNGTIDDVMIFNRSLSAEQIFALWQNKTNIIVAQETARYENWTVQATPNDGTSDGIFTDGSISIANESVLNAKPTIAYVTVNTSNLSRNNTVLNLTAFKVNATDVDSIDSVKLIYNWLVNNTPIAVVNMPFERVNGTDTNNAQDYSGLGNHGNESGGIIWNVTGGYDSKGAYEFDGSAVNSRYLNLGDRDHFKNICVSGCTFSMWVYPRNLTSQKNILGRFNANNEDRFFAIYTSSSVPYLVLHQNGSDTPKCQSQNSGVELIANAWNHVVARFNLTHNAMFINGTQKSVALCSSQGFTGINVTAWADSEKTLIGAYDDDSPVFFWNGTIDEVMIFNRSLSAEQIFALFQNKTNTTVAQETAGGDNWSVQVTPNDGIEDGLMNTSNNVTILNIKPLISSLVLNSTNISTNNTDVNLTAYANGTDTADGDSVKVIYNWLRNGTSITVLNMPFEGVNGSGNDNAYDYSGLGHNGSEQNSPVWNATGGYDNKGAYMFDGSTVNDKYIFLGNRSSIKSTCLEGCTISAWIYKGMDSDSNGRHGIVTRFGAGGDQFFAFAIANSNNAPEFRIYENRSTSGLCQASSGKPILNQSWHYVTARYNLTHTAVFINGTQQGVTACSFASVNKTVWTDDPEPVIIGALRPEALTWQFNGTIDDVMIFNRSLSNEQIFALWQNKTNIITAQETTKNENWTVQATPNDGSLDGTLDDGSIVISGNVSILNTKPIISPLVLNSTNPRANHTGTHLIAYANSSDADSDDVKVIYNWLRNDTPIALLNMPFERINNSDTDNAWDYSGYQHNGSVVGATWNASAGYDGKGAYLFDDNGDYIELTQHLSRLEGLNAGTISLWYRSNDSTSNGDYLLTITDKDVSTDLMAFIVGPTTGAYTDEGLNFLVIRGGTTVLSMYVREGETKFKDLQWHHLAVVTGDGDNRMYIDGVRKPLTFGAGSVATNEFSNINNPDKSFIGRYHVGGTAFDSAGRRDDILIFNRSLSEEEVVALFNNRTDKIVSRELLVAENWSVEATPNDGSEDGTTATSNNVTILANTVPSITSLVLNSTIAYLNSTNQNLTAYANKTDLNNDSVKIIYNWLRNGVSITPLNMPFERINGTNTNNAWDYSGRSNTTNGTVSGATWVEDAGYDSKGAYRFDGIDDFIGSVGNLSDYSFVQNTGNFTIEGWIKLADYTQNSLQSIAGNTPTTAEKGFLFYYENRTGGLGHNHLALTLNRGVAATYAVYANSSNFVIVDNNWHHVAVVGNGTNVTFYVDGIDVSANGTISNMPTGNANRVLNIGRYNGATPAGYFNGTIDELRIWEKTLSSQQIWTIFSNRTDRIAYNETTAGENWTVDAIPNDGLADGATVRSNQVIITGLANSKPVITSLYLNTTNHALNDTSTNLTALANTSDAEGNSVKIIYNWIRKDKTITTLNIPFEGINKTTGSIGNAWDYSGLGNNGSETNGVLWSATGGYDGKGAYIFDGINDRIHVEGTNETSRNVSQFAWVYLVGGCPGGRCSIIGQHFPHAGNHLEVVSGQVQVYGYLWSTPTWVVGGTVNNNQWHHVGFTYHSNTTEGNITLYVDGLPVTSQQSAARSGNMAVRGILEIGAINNGGREWNGTIDEVLIFNRSLSAEEIKLLWANQSLNFSGRDVAHGENWSVQATPNDGLEDGVMLTSNNVTIKGKPIISPLILNTTNLSSNRTEVNLTAYANASDLDGDSVKVIYNWLRNDTPIATLNMPFEKINGTSTDNAWDYSGFENNGSQENATWNATGGYDSKGAYEFQGIDNNYNQRIKIPFNESFNLTDKPFTAMAWIKHHTAATSGDTVICQGSACGSCLGSYSIQIKSDGKFQFQTYNTTQACGSENGLTQLDSSSSISADKWTHVAGVYNGTNLLMYVNGLYETTIAARRPIYTINAPIYIGWGHAVFHWNGTIDEVMVFNRSLSSDQIFRIFKNESYSIVLNETSKGENWTIEATPNDGTYDGEMVISSNVTILNTKPVITVPVILNSTLLTRNGTDNNLTAYVNYSDADSDSVKIIYNWLKDDKSFMLVNMPFEGMNGTANGTRNNTRDYSEYNSPTSIIEVGSPFWNGSGGHDGKGAYNFDGSTQFVSIKNESLFDFKNFTYVVWYKADTNSGFDTMIDVDTDKQFLGFSGTSYILYGRCTGNPTHGTSKLNVWTMLTLVVNGSSYYLYENATLIGSGSGCSASIDGTYLNIGAGATSGPGGAGDEFFDGHLDDIKIFNFSLSAEQISALYLNKTSEIASSTLSFFPSSLQNWSVEATPNDGTEDGLTISSNNVTVRDLTGPEIRIFSPTANHTNLSSGSMILNISAADVSGVTSCSYSVNDGVTNFTLRSCSSENYIIPGKGYSLNVTIYALDGANNVGKTIVTNVTVGAVPNISAITLRTTDLTKNDTTTNLSAVPTVNEGDGDTPKVIYNWYINNSPLMVLNMPFERLNGTNGSNVKDYTGLNPVGKISELGGVAWNDSRGFDNRGVYHFDGSNDFISVTNESLFDLKNFSFVVWITAESTSAGWHTILDVDTDKQLLGRNGANYAIFGRCGTVTPGTVKVGIPTMLTWAVNGSTYQLYENTTVISSGSGCSGGVDGTYLNIGAGSSNGVTPDELFDGYIDDIRIFNLSLTAEQVSALYYNRTNETASSMLFVSQNWSVDATPNDGYDDGNTMRSNNVTIKAVAGGANTPPPAPVLVSPANRSTTTSRTPTFIWNNSVDADSNPNISYRLEIDNNILFNNPEVNVTGIINTTNDNTTYTISTELAVDTTFFWRVFAYDQTDYSTTANVGNFTVQSLLSINITNNLVALGTLAPGANVSTPANANPFRGENVGNIVANITVTGTPFFTAVGMPSSFYRFKIRANESGAFNTTASATEWNETNSTLNAGVFHVVNLDWHSVSNDFLTDLNISVPGNESAGSKTSEITFTITG